METIEITVNIPNELVLETLINGFETTQWCRVPDYHYQNIEKWFNDPTDSLKVFDFYEDERPYELTKKKLVRALTLMAEKHPKYFSDLVSENFDAITSDVLLQLALFGELVYG